MRRSAAPSQKNVNTSRAPFFSPPYKTPVQAPVPQKSCNPVTAFTTAEKKTEESKASLRSPAELLDVIKGLPAQEKENAHIVKDSSTFLEYEVKSASALNQTPLSERKEMNCKRSRSPDLSTHNAAQTNQIETRYFSVVWCKLSKKKHKNWEGDALLIVKGRSVTIKDLEGKEIGRSSGYKLKDLETLEEGNTLPVGAKEVEIQHEIEAKDYLSGKCFQSSTVIDTPSEPPPPKRIKPKPFCLPFKGRVGGQLDAKKCAPKPLYDASHANALVLPRPPAHHQWTYNTGSLSVVDVVVDPHVGGQLRPHQRAGVVFLYECVMGFRIKRYCGAILADEMGLGKTLQCIALIWTLMKQGPYGGSPLLKRVLIVTPSSLVSNWGKEFEKWLGKQRLSPYIVDQRHKVGEFLKQKLSPVLIISYEMLIRCVDQLQEASFDLLLCDEGHRLKNGQIKTSTLLSSLNVQRRVILTGTPVQNDLQELYSLVEFVNSGILGTSTMFRKVFEEPILKSQQPSASFEEKETGENRATELNRLTSQFTLRRTQDIINKYLPPKTEYVVFCQPSKTQMELYEAVVGCRGLQKCLMNSEVGDHLAAICILRKLCNHPSLLLAKEGKEERSEINNEIGNLIPVELGQNISSEEESGKLAVLSCLLWSLAECKRERVVVVSNFTTTLDMIQHMCERYDYPFLRLDGSTPSAKRQVLVDKFNRPQCQEFVFLLSSKAGGVGLNLIGASRIVLFDVDWNPATDLQAMARVWRDGQRKDVFIYRFLLAGSIEEKIYQRQVRKQGISSSVVDARCNGKVQFSTEELKDLFRFHPNVSCLTHDLLNCPCDQMGGEGQKLCSLENSDTRDCHLVKESNPQRSSTTMDQLFSWQHYSLPQARDLLDDPYLESGSDFISFVFKCKDIQ